MRDNPRMAYTQTDLDNLNQAITALATGKRRTSATIAGNRIDYAPVDLPQLRALRDEVAAALSPRRNSFVLVSTSKGT
jgi:CO/xanthine dehydrogenase FAD-binding subunit